MILGAKREMWFTVFRSLLPTWYFNAKYLAYVSGTSLLTDTVVILTLLPFSACQHAGFPLELLPCVSLSGLWAPDKVVFLLTLISCIYKHQ